MTNVCCTICSKNYIAFARTLMHSLKETTPDVDRCVLLVDEDHSEIRQEEEDFTIVWVQELAIPDFEIMAFQYDITELNTAVKPVYLQHLFQKGYDKIIYLDPDIYVYRNLEKLFTLLDDFYILLTPHILTPTPDDGCQPHEPFILLSGLYNLGFLGVKHCDDVDQLLLWWNNRLKDRCIIAHERGLFVDQKWIDLVPIFYDHVYIIKDPGFNVAYWNLHERLPINFDAAHRPKIHQQHAIYFYHFSGIHIDDLLPISKHQDRFTLNVDTTGLKILFEDYREQILKNGHEAAQQWTYAFNYFDNGTPIKRKVRRKFLAKQDKTKFGNPFQTSLEKSFYKKVYPPRTRKTAFKQFLLKPFRLALRILRKCDKIFQSGFPNSIRPLLKSRKIVGRNGMNIAGYLQAELGIAEAARSLIYCLKKRKIEYVLNNFSFGTQSRLEDKTLGDVFTESNPFFCNLININADQLPRFHEQKPGAYFKHKYNIGVWYWELEQFPTQWESAFQLIDELWVATDFIQNALSPASTVPIVKIPPAIIPPSEIEFSRLAIGIPEHAFTFLFFFDFFSSIERKNPFGVIEAFRKAFPSSAEKVNLVLKCSNYDHPSVKAKAKLLNVAINNDPRIILLPQYFTRMQMWELLAASDVFISLHRSEGLGLGLLEAMSLGKPVIGTAYGGNMDFMTPYNSSLVKYKLVEIPANYGPYQKGNIWAEPDIDTAAKIMRNVYEDQPSAQLIGEAARQEIREKYSPDVIGKKIEHRLKVIVQNNDVKILT